MDSSDHWPSEDEPCLVCSGSGLIGTRTCPACQTQSGPMGLDGWITCHYLDNAGRVQRFTHLSTEPLSNALQRQEDMRAAMELMCRELGYEVLSIQLVIVGADQVRRVSPLRKGSTAQVIAFPVRQRSSMD